MVQQSVCIGVLALQGAFAEHIAIIDKLNLPQSVRAIQVRTPAQLAECSALILPGGESTTISLLAQKSGLLEPLRDFVRDAREGRSGRAVWGTCAGMILLADQVVGPKEGYQGLEGANYKVVRNQWGRQSESFAYPLSIPALGDKAVPFMATFIRAPVVHTLLPEPKQACSSPPLEVLARVPREILPLPSKAALTTGGCELGPDADVVMLRQGNVLATSFHPELGQDTRVHRWWVETMVLEST